MKLSKQECIDLVKKHSDNLQVNLMIKNFRIDNINDIEVFRFTMGIMSAEFLNSLRSDKKIKDIMYNPSFTPPGGSLDSISLRYKIYLLFN